MMSAPITASVDTTAFNRIFQDLGDVLPQDGLQFVKEETARLAEECARQLETRNRKAKGDHTISRDIRAVFIKAPKHPFRDHRAEGSHGMTWLYATPDALVGVKTYRDWRDQSVSSLASIFRKSKLPPEAWKELGTMDTSRWNPKTHSGRRQHVSEIQRLVVSRGAYGQFVAQIKSHQGRLEASFADTAQKLRGQAKVGSRIKRHFPSKTNVHRDGGLSNKAYPQMEFGSEAPGVEQFQSQVDAAVSARTRKMMDRMNLIASGYARDATSRLRIGRAATQTGVME